MTNFNPPPEYYDPPEEDEWDEEADIDIDLYDLDEDQLEEGKVDVPVWGGDRKGWTWGGERSEW